MRRNAVMAILIVLAAFFGKTAVAGQPTPHLPDISPKEITHDGVLCGCDTTNIITFTEWKLKTGDPGPLSIDFVESRLADKNYSSSENILIVVNANLQDSIETALGQYVTDLTAEGYSVEVYAWSGGTPADLRAFLQDKYNAGMDGTLFIGDLPVAWYGDSPNDHYYMDLTAVWEDTTGDGILDTFTGDITPEIWFGRLTPSTLDYTGQSEAELLNNYFSKNHLYRTDQLELNNRALLFDAYGPAGDDEFDLVFREAYHDLNYVFDDSLRVDTVFERLLTENYEFAFVSSHGNADAIVIGNSAGNTFTYSSEIIDFVHPQVHFYLIDACVTGRYVDADYIAGWFIFFGSYGLGSIGATDVIGEGACRPYTGFAHYLAQGHPFGVVFFEWLTDRLTNPYSYAPTALTYIGDPTLKPIYCDPARGDSDEDGVADDCDYCPEDYDPDQLDADGDYLGDECDECTDTDDDGYGNPGYPASLCPIDNCPNVYNPDQTDLDSDGIGDACDECVDTDGDGYGNPCYSASTCQIDNCPDDYNPDQTDSDDDGLGDACDCYGMSDTLLWTVTYDFNGSDVLYSLEQAPDGNYRAVGSCGGSSAFYLELEISKCGHIVWRNCPYISGYEDAGYSLRITPDSGSLIAATLRESWQISKRDPLWNEEWEWTPGGASGAGNAKSACRLSDGRYIMAGSGFDGAFALRLTSSGQYVSGNGVYYGYGGDEFNDVVAAENGAFVATGFKQTAGGPVAVVVKYDANLNQVWDAQLPCPDTADDIAYSIVNTDNGGYAVAGTRTYSATESRFHVIRLDSMGDMVWDTTYGANNVLNEARSIHGTDGGGFMIAGYRVNSVNPAYHDGYILTISGDKTLISQYSITASGILHLYDIDITSDGYIVVAGSLNDDVFIRRYGVDSTSCCDVPGDVNHDGNVIIGDIVYLNAYLFYGGPPPPCFPEADANGDCAINSGDAVYLVNSIFKGGPPPVDCTTTGCQW